MSLTTRSIYNANPSTFDATQTGVSIGDLVVDPAGVNAPGLIEGPNSARTVAPLGGAASDVLIAAIVIGAPLSGLATLNIQIANSALVPIPDAMVLVGYSSTLFAGAFSGISTGIGLLNVAFNVFSGTFIAKANNVGQISLNYAAGSTAVVTFTIASLSSTPGDANPPSYISP